MRSELVYLLKLIDEIKKAIRNQGKEPPAVVSLDGTIDLIGALTSTYEEKLSYCQGQLSNCNQQLSKCNGDLSNCQDQLQQCQSDLQSCQSQSSSTDQGGSASPSWFDLGRQLFNSNFDVAVKMQKESDEVDIKEGTQTIFQPDTFYVAFTKLPNAGYVKIEVTNEDVSSEYRLLIQPTDNSVWFYVNAHVFLAGAIIDIPYLLNTSIGIFQTGNAEYFPYTLRVEGILPASVLAGTGVRILPSSSSTDKFGLSLMLVPFTL